MFECARIIRNNLLQRKTGPSLNDSGVNRKCPERKCPGGKCPGGKCPGGKCPGGKCPGGKCPGGKCPGGKSPGGKCPGGKCPPIKLPPADFPETVVLRARAPRAPRLRRPAAPRLSPPTPGVASDFRLRPPAPGFPLPIVLNYPPPTSLKQWCCAPGRRGHHGSDSRRPPGFGPRPPGWLLTSGSGRRLRAPPCRFSETTPFRFP